MDRLALCISSTFFTGFLPGTIIGKKGAGGGLMGSIVAFLIQALFLWLNSSYWADVGLIAGSLVLGLISIERAERYMYQTSGARERHTGELTAYDFNETNIDEVHGQAIAGFLVFVAPFDQRWHAYAFLVGTLICFRVFDTKKPWPIRVVEKNLPGAAGIMLDDSVAGIFSAVTVYIAYIIYWYRNI